MFIKLNPCLPRYACHPVPRCLTLAICPYYDGVISKLIFLYISFNGDFGFYFVQINNLTLKYVFFIFILK